MEGAGSKMRTCRDAVMEFTKAMEPFSMHGWILEKNGQVLSEGVWKPFSLDRMHRMYSVSKSVTSLAVGILAQEQKLALSDPIVRYFPEMLSEKTPDLLKQVTIQQMLEMATCYAGAQYRVTDADWTRPFFEGNPTHEPGTLFSYDTSASQVLCVLVEKLAGEDILCFMEKRLFRLIGMTGEKKWLKDPSGTSQGGTGLLMSLRDLSRLAQYMMTDGQNIIPECYLKAAVEKHIDTLERPYPEEKYGYGWQFWRTRHGFSMYGLGGQMAICIPEKKMSLCTVADLTMNGTGVQPIYDAFFSYLSDFDTLPEGDGTETAMCLSLKGVEGTTRSGVTEIVLSSDTLPFDRVRICEDSVALMVEGREWTLPYAPHTYAEGIFPVCRDACISSGGWVSENRFVLLCELWGDWTCSVQLQVVTAGARASVRLQSSLYECMQGWEGTASGKVVVL